MTVVLVLVRDNTCPCDTSSIQWIDPWAKPQQFTRYITRCHFLCWLLLEERVQYTASVSIPFKR